MRLSIIILSFFLGTNLFAQGFECDGSFYMVIYTQSEGKSTLYKITEQDFKFEYQPIELSESRRLTGLSYNVNDKHLVALDVDTYELIKIDNRGTITVIGVPDNINQDLIFSSGTFTAEGGGIVMFGYDPLFEKDTEIVNVDVGRAYPYAGSLGVTGSHAVQITDLATDPITGAIYAFDKIRGTMIQISVGGGTSSLDYPVLEVNSIDALFFNRDGILFGYSPSRGMYAFDKGDGSITSLGKIPEGTHADGCSCPYTFEFEKIIEPVEIVPCEPFEVVYNFENKMGVGQIIDEFRDSFPPGFEIVDIESDLISSSFTDIDITQPNILSISTFIYLLGDNTITISVKPPPLFRGTFESSALQGDFPLAYGETMLSDDPNTNFPGDATAAEVISENEIDFTDYIKYSCDGQTATISAPISSNDYLWSTGEVISEIQTMESGWYSLRADNECISYFDSVEIASFPEARSFSLGADEAIILGDTINVQLDLDALNADEINWFYNNEELNCNDCNELKIAPTIGGELLAILIDADGCEMESSKFIEVLFKREVFKPNTFSPNGDGVNDYFYFSTAAIANVKNLKVFNRWGNLIFEKSDFPTNNKMDGWDGTFNTSNLKSSVYVYIAELEFPDGFTDLVSGEILLISN